MDYERRHVTTVRTRLRLLGLVILALVLPTPVAAQPAPGYIQLTPPVGMRWKTQDQSALTKDTVITDTEGNIWVKTSALPQLSQSMVLVQLVGDSGETNQWMTMRDTATWLSLPYDMDWSNYREISSQESWQELIALYEGMAKQGAELSGAAVPGTVVLPIYVSPSHPGWEWSSPADGPMRADADVE